MKLLLLIITLVLSSTVFSQTVGTEETMQSQTSISNYEYKIILDGNYTNTKMATTIIRRKFENLVNYNPEINGYTFTSPYFIERESLQLEFTEYNFLIANYSRNISNESKE